MKTRITRTIASIVTAAFIFTQCGITSAFAGGIYKEGQNLREVTAEGKAMGLLGKDLQAVGNVIGAIKFKWGDQEITAEVNDDYIYFVHDTTVNGEPGFKEHVKIALRAKEGDFDCRAPGYVTVKRAYGDTPFLNAASVEGVDVAKLTYLSSVLWRSEDQLLQALAPQLWTINTEKGKQLSLSVDSSLWLKTRIAWVIHRDGRTEITDMSQKLSERPSVQEVVKHSSEVVQTKFVMHEPQTFILPRTPAEIRTFVLKKTETLPIPQTRPGPGRVQRKEIPYNRIGETVVVDVESIEKAKLAGTIIQDTAGKLSFSGKAGTAMTKWVEQANSGMETMYVYNGVKRKAYDRENVFNDIVAGTIVKDEVYGEFKVARATGAAAGWEQIKPNQTKEVSVYDDLGGNNRVVIKLGKEGYAYVHFGINLLTMLQDVTDHLGYAVEIRATSDERGLNPIVDTLAESRISAAARAVLRDHIYVNSDLRENGQVCNIGRANFNQMVINHQYVSKGHLKIELKDDKLYITDVGSTNGTFVKIASQLTVNAARATGAAMGGMPANAAAQPVVATSSSLAEDTLIGAHVVVPIGGPSDVSPALVGSANAVRQDMLQRVAARQATFSLFVVTDNKTEAAREITTLIPQGVDKNRVVVTYHEVSTELTSITEAARAIKEAQGKYNNIAIYIVTSGLQESIFNNLIDLEVLPVNLQVESQKAVLSKGIGESL